MEEHSKTIYLTDSPDIEKDSFQIHTNISEMLFDIIKKQDVSKRSFTIGLFGEWGSGKSFIINKLSRKIKENTIDITFINIDVWKYSGQPLLRSILFELDRQFKSFFKKDKKKYEKFKDGYKNSKGKSLQDILYYDEIFESESKLSSREFKDKLKIIWKRYKWPYIFLLLIFISFLCFQFISTDLLQKPYIKKIYDLLKALAPVSSFVGISGLLIFLFKKPLENIVDLTFFRNTVKNFTEKANFSPEQFEGIFRDMLSKIEKEKYVLVFDNIDRCEPKVAYETLSTIKTFMDIHNCFYIITADDEAIKEYLSNSIKNDNLFHRKYVEEFIDKIFQTYIRIPILKEVERDKYIREQLNKIDLKKNLSEEDTETITQILYFAYKGESPRNIIRFLNDYSTYFLLALKSLPNLLDNITLFTIMIAIKQKWYQFEKILLENTDFFYKYPSNKNILENLDSNIKNDLINFLDNISSSYIPQIKFESVNSYIHFKESEKSFEISEALKNNHPEKIIINHEILKILIKEFKKNILIKGAFSINSFLTFSSLIIENLENKHSVKLIKEFWIGFIDASSEQISLLFSKLLQNNTLTKIINTLKYTCIKHHRNDIEKKFIEYLTEPIKNDAKNKDYQDVFNVILNSEFKFNPYTLNKIFEKWNISNEYLKSLLKIISENNKTEYLPTNVLNSLINDDIDDSSLEILRYWNHENIPKSYGIRLVKITSNRIESRNFVNYQQLTQQESLIDQDYELLLLLDISFLTEDNKEEFIQNIVNLTSKIFQFSNDQQPLFELGIKFWIEIAYFGNVDKELIDSELLKIFDSYIKQNPSILSILQKNIKYSKDILSLDKLKQEIFNTFPELQIKIYEDLDEKDFANFELVMSYPVNIDHISTYIDSITKKEISIDKNEFSKYLLQQIIKEMSKESIDISEKLEYLMNEFDLSVHKKITIENKNGFIDYYKKSPKTAIRTLKLIKSTLTYTEFYSNFLNTILKFIDSKLGESENISDFKNISEIIESTNNQNTISLLFSLAKKCLERNQEIDENYLGIELVNIVFKNISSEDKNFIINLIKNNDNFSQWDKETKSLLKILGIIKEESN